MSWRSTLTYLGIFFLLSSAAYSNKFPQLTGRVVDEAGVISAPAQNELIDLSNQLESQTSHQLVVATLNDLKNLPLDDYGPQLGRHWKIGQKGKNNGVMLLLAPNTREVRIEVGYGLEGELPDIIANQILQNQVIPKLKAGDIDGALTQGAQAIYGYIAKGELPEKKQNVTYENGDFDDLIGAIMIIIGIAYFIIYWVVRRKRGGGGPRGGGSGGFGGFGGFGSGGSSGGFSGGGGSFGGGGAGGRY